MIPERTLAYRPMPRGKGQTYDARLGQSRTDYGQPNTEQIAERHSSDHPALGEKCGI